MTTGSSFQNPFKPGAGHMPPYLAGRESERDEFRRLIDQDAILENMVLTGLRGVGKTVLLDTLKPIAVEAGWLWAGTDLSESASISEANMALRLLTDLSVATASIAVAERIERPVGFGATEQVVVDTLDFRTLRALFEARPGLVEDKVKHVLEIAWQIVEAAGYRGVIFAYDEAQNLADNAAAGEYPLSVLLDVFQSIQKRDVRFMLVLTGLPTLFPKLVEARTFAERMFRVVELSRLDEPDCRAAITRPIADAESPVTFTDESVRLIVDESAGYPYFVQFICREVYDVFIQRSSRGQDPGGVPIDAITRKLDSDFFAGRWARATDRQRELLYVIARTLVDSEAEFAVQRIVELSREMAEDGSIAKAFSASHAGQMLVTLCDAGLVYKNRHGRYSLAVPLFDRFVLRQFDTFEKES